MDFCKDHLELRDLASQPAISLQLHTESPKSALAVATICLRAATPQRRRTYDTEWTFALFSLFSNHETKILALGPPPACLMSTMMIFIWVMIRSAVNLGYMKDPFVHHFVRKPTKRPPLINRGYFARQTAIDTLIDGFLKAGGDTVKKQIISLGAGFDTRFFQLKSAVRRRPFFFFGGKNLISSPFVQGVASLARYVEVDFPEVVAAKVEIIKATQEVHGVIGTDLQCLPFTLHSSSSSSPPLCC